MTLTSDFGQRDGYVAAMVGVILSVEADLRVVNVTSDVAAQDVVAGAFALRAACPRYPKGTVHLAVVDPGVGTARAAIVARAGGHVFVAPDNGLLTPVLDALGLARPHRGWRIAPGPLGEVSATFHGRDVFAPTAARLAAGLVRPRDLGPEVSLEALSLPTPRREGDQLVGCVIYADHFGNLITNLDRVALGGAAPLSARAAGTKLPLGRTYGDVGPGEAVALFGSDGQIELAVRDGSARRVLGLAPGGEVRVQITGNVGDDSL